MDRKAPRVSRLSHSNTPYSRPSTSKTAEPSTPAPARGNGAQTPSRLLSKVFSMFTPSRWGSQNSEVEDHAEVSQEKTENPEPETIEQSSTKTNDDTPMRYLPFLFSPAKQPTTPVRPFQSTPFTPAQSQPAPSQTGPSPNQKLAEFFQKKGNAPLSDIEMEGVLALMKQAHESQNKEQHNEPTQRPMSLSQPPQISAVVGSPSITEQLYPSVPSFATPNRHRRAASSTAGVRAPRYNPIFTPQRRPQHNPIVTRPKTPSQLPSISTPFRARSATPGPRHSTPTQQSPAKTAAVSTPVTALVASSPAPSTAKRLSQTASALLSLIEPVGSPSEVAAARIEDRERLTDPKLKPFVNPYAVSSSTTVTPRRKQVRRETLAGTAMASARKKRSAIEEIERTMPVEEKVGAFASAVATVTSTPVLQLPPAANDAERKEPKSAAVPSTPSREGPQVSDSTTPEKATPPSILDKFKPTKSSHLRESIVMSPPASPVSSSRSPEKKSTTSPLPASAASVPAAMAAVPMPIAKRGESEEKALASNDYKAYVPRFYFSEAGDVPCDADGVKKKARETPDVMFQDYKHKFVFPDIVSSSSL